MFSSCFLYSLGFLLFLRFSFILLFLRGFFFILYSYVIYLFIYFFVLRVSFCCLYAESFRLVFFILGVFLLFFDSFEGFPLRHNSRRISPPSESLAGSHPDRLQCRQPGMILEQQQANPRAFFQHSISRVLLP